MPLSFLLYLIAAEDARTEAASFDLLENPT